MAVKLKRKAVSARFLMSRWGRALLLLFALGITTGLAIFTYYYVKYAQITEEKLRSGPFANTSLLYAAPRPVMVGDQAKTGEIAAYLQRCGYSESSNTRIGWYRERADAIEINPGPDAYDSEGAVVKVQGGKVTRIISLRDQSERTQ